MGNMVHAGHTNKQQIAESQHTENRRGYTHTHAPAALTFRGQRRREGSRGYGSRRARGWTTCPVVPRRTAGCGRVRRSARGWAGCAAVYRPTLERYSAAQEGMRRYGSVAARACPRVRAHGPPLPAPAPPWPPPASLCALLRACGSGWGCWPLLLTLWPVWGWCGPVVGLVCGGRTVGCGGVWCVFVLVRGLRAGS